MTPKSPFTLTRLLAIAILALLAVLAFPTPAHALGDIVGVEAAIWPQSLSGNAAIDNGSTQGTTIDFKNDLGLKDKDSTPQGRLWLRLGRNYLTFDYNGSSRSGDGVLNKSVNYNGTTYSSGETIQSKYDLNLIEAQYRFDFVKLKLVDFGLGVGLNLAQIKMQLNGSSSGLTKLDENVPYPTVNAALVIKPLPGFHIRAEANGLSVNVGGNKVQILDARLQLEYYFLHAFGILGGYRSYRFTVDAKDFGHVENTFNGPYVGLGVKF